MRNALGIALVLSASLAGGWGMANAGPAGQTPPAARVQPPAPGPSLSEEQRASAAANYQTYCALCHGPDRAGHANDEAPSLRTPSLYRTSYPLAVFDALRYGRPGTPMGGYSDEIGGPLSRQDMVLMARWLQEQAGVPFNSSGPPLPSLPKGDARHGASVYARECASCHGDAGQGGTGTALRNPAMLALTPDGFLLEAILHGREGTQMEGFAGRLSLRDAASVLAWMRHDNSGGQLRPARMDPPPPPEAWILNPKGKPPQFTLKDGMYVSAADLHEALKAKPRIVLLDTRVMSMWQAGHIAGAVPMPYYSSREEVMRNIPRDGTWIVGYCECPRAAAESVIRRLREQGVRNTAVVWEGIGGWVAAGYPTVQGTVENAPSP